jgi:hypothetical protein
MRKQWSVSLVVQNAIRKIEKVLHVLAFSLESNTTTIDAIIIGPAWNVDTSGSKTKGKIQTLDSKDNHPLLAGSIEGTVDADGGLA